MPRKFGRLNLLKPIARGGMGEVHLATSGGIEGAERPCVVKIIRREHANDSSFLARFFDEARIQAQLQHPGVAQILEASVDPSGKPFVVVEYVEGRNLGEIRTRGSQLNANIAWAEAVAIATCIAEALAHVHERTDASGRPLEIVHRDLSPQNVMVGYAGDVKLIDFGTARGQNRRCHTVSGIVFAKPGYVAPEVANNQPGGVPADLYALGIILWELIAGRRFLTGEASAHLAAVARGTRNPSPLAELVKAPPELDTVIARLTAPRIEDRYACAREALADLVRLMTRAPSLANGERGVRPRIAHLMHRLYPAEPARSRAELNRLIGMVRHSEARTPVLPESPNPLPAARSAELLPGTRYRLVRELGRGAMGVVYEAHHVDLGRLVALKVLPKERCENPEFEARFRTEARAIARLRHVNLVTLHDFGVSADGRPFYAMELLEGQTLERYLARERGMEWREAVRVGIDACNALGAAHRSGLVHRDIKPANLFLTKEGTLKLLDFGIAKTDAEVQKDDGQSALSLLGTPEYMSPEQAAGMAIDERADLYALGAVLYELLTGSLPHSAGSTIALLDQKLSTDPEPPRRRSPQRALPKPLDRVVLKALRRSPAQRYATAAEMRAALEAALHHPARQRARRRLAATATLCAGVVTLGAAVVANGGRPEVRARAATAMRPLKQWLSPGSGDDRARAEEATGLPSTVAPPRTGNPIAIVEEAPVDLAEDPTEPSDLGHTEADEATLHEELDEPEQEPARAREPEPENDDALRAELARAERFTGRGQHIGALSVYRALARTYPKDFRVLEGWSQSARRTKGWGEALEAAIRWASADSSARAHLHLARVQRAVGEQDGALQTLERLLHREPENAEAQALFRRYGGERLASRQ